jgi:hypothetical protein
MVAQITDRHFGHGGMVSRVIPIAKPVIDEERNGVADVRGTPSWRNLQVVILGSTPLLVQRGSTKTLAIRRQAVACMSMASVSFSR